MYDTLNFRLTQQEVSEVDFLAETSCHLEDVVEHCKDGLLSITGRLGGLKISLNRFQLRVNGGSLCKWYLGDNYKTLGRKDTQMALEKLSDTLHLSMEKARVTRLDIAQNFIMQNPPEVYMGHLGILRYAKRLENDGSLYYKQTDRILCVYDKNREQRSKREPIPELYQGRNVLRYEQRYLGHLERQIRVPEVTGASLFDEAFYVRMLNGWRDTYLMIEKIGDIAINFQDMKTKHDLYNMSVAAMVADAGGEVKVLEQITEAMKRRELTRAQAFRLRQAVREACKVGKGAFVSSGVIEELDKKVKEAVRFYR